MLRRANEDLAVIHKGRPHGGGGGVWPNVDKSGQGRGGRLLLSSADRATTPSQQVFVVERSPSWVRSSGYYFCVHDHLSSCQARFFSSGGGQWYLSSAEPLSRMASLHLIRTYRYVQSQTVNAAKPPVTVSGSYLRQADYDLIRVS